MFERVLAPPSSRRRSSVVLIATAVGHAVVLSALAIAAFWKIEALPVVDNSQVRVAVTLDQPPAGGPPPGARLKVARAPEKKLKPDVITQPKTVAEVPPLPPSGPTTDGDNHVGPPGGGGDNPDGDPDSTETGTGSCGSPPCGEAPPTPDPDPPAKVVAKAPAVLDPKTAAGLRISGEAQIYPPDAVKAAIFRDGKAVVTSVFKVCVSDSGAIASVSMQRSTGYDGYDQKLMSAMRQWRYRPYTVNGTPAPMCFSQIVNYRIAR